MKKSTLIFFFVLIPLAFWLGIKISQYQTSKNGLVVGSKEKFEYLAKQSSNRCGLLGSEIMTSMSDKDRIQGSCCSPMDIHAYQEQVEGLRKYAKISQIPKDPYDISVSLAKELLEYKKSLTLTSEQQEVYNEAMGLAKEGGPCCCRCWRWDAFEGQAKYLITRRNFKSDEIAKVWDLEDGCGGGGHIQEHG